MFLDLITDENQQYFGHLIPKEYQSRTGLPGIICAGASVYEKEPVPAEQEKATAQPKEDEWKLTPAGVIVLSVAGLDTVEVLWLAVDPVYREREIATRLLKEAFELAKKLQRDRLLVGIPRTEGEYGITKRFFVSRGFAETGISYREWSFVPWEMPKVPAEDPKEKEHAFVLLDRLPGDTQDTVLALAVAENLDSPFTVVREFIDLKKTVICMDEGEPTEGILVHRAGQIVRPVFFETENTDYERRKHMLHFFLREIISKLTGSVLVHFRCEAGMLQGDLSEALEGIPYLDMTYLSADADSFDKAEEEIRKQNLRETLVQEAEEAFATEFRETQRELAGGEILYPVKEGGK